MGLGGAVCDVGAIHQGVDASNGDYGRIEGADYRRMAGRRPGRSLALSSDVPARQLSPIMSDGAEQTQPRSRLLRPFRPAVLRNPRRRPSLLFFNMVT